MKISLLIAMAVSLPHCAGAAKPVWNYTFGAN
jgi:hypothetical protein